MPKFERKMLTATTLLLTLVAAAFAPGVADAKSTASSRPACVGAASITVDVSPKTVDGSGDTKVRSDVTNCGSATATFVVQHTFDGGFWPNHYFCLRTLTPDSTVVTLGPGETTLVQFARPQPSCVGIYNLLGTVALANQTVAEGRDSFSLSLKSRRNR